MFLKAGFSRWVPSINRLPKVTHSFTIFCLVFVVVVVVVVFLPFNNPHCSSIFLKILAVPRSVVFCISSTGVLTPRQLRKLSSLLGTIPNAPKTNHWQYLCFNLPHFPHLSCQVLLFFYLFFFLFPHSSIHWDSYINELACLFSLIDNHQIWSPRFDIMVGLDVAVPH